MQSVKQPDKRRQNAVTPNAIDQPASGDWVVLVHGLFATSRSMRTLHHNLSASNYRVFSWNYPTFWQTVQHTARRMIPWLVELELDPRCQSINFVTHSLGAIVVRCVLERAMLQTTDLRKVKRVVMLAPPNRGSHLTRFSPNPLAWFVPAIAELMETPDSLPNRLRDPHDVEFGVIAAEHDLVVPVSHTSHPQQKDHCTLPTTHFHLPHHSAVVDQVQTFLQTGRFKAA